MALISILYNAVIIAIELGLVAGLAWLAYAQPLLFAALTAALAFAFGVYLEYARIRYELGFYFGKAPGAASLFVQLFALGSAVAKGVAAGVVSLLTFSGTDQARLWWVALVFGGILLLGTGFLRRLRLSLGAIPARWGYFRLALPLGVLFSLAVAFLPVPSLASLAGTLADTPLRPSLAQASEVLFLLKQKFDEIITGLLSLAVGPDWGRIAGALLSVNVLAGFVIAVYAVMIAGLVERMEERAP